MKLLIELFFLHLRLVYFMMKLRPMKQNKVVMLSRQSDTPSLDFIMLKDELLKQHPDAEVVVLNRMLKKSLKSMIGFYLHMYVQLFHLSNARIVIIDTYCIPVSMFHHRQGMKVVQIWHALGAIKKFGLQTTGSAGGRNASISQAMRMHQNYDAVVSASDAMIPYFAQAFHTDTDKFITIGLPRIDYLTESKQQIRQRILTAYPELKSEKPIVLYAPTFRRNKGVHIEQFLQDFDFERYTLIFKHHPLFQMEITDPRILTIPEVSSLDLLTIADVVISDYSALTLEAVAIDRPVFLYVYDYEEYCEDVGLNVSLYQELPGCVFQSARELFDAMKQPYPTETMLTFKQKYLAYTDGKVTERLASFCWK
ncbi:MAG: CDP-glycerol glycerophosphotransferase family protein [Erysipelotrichaceae bacterium]|nr:CDP-glycerol glycerophosphotransferase family protein [Erysipelotrichaceae bacterium]